MLNKTAFRNRSKLEIMYDMLNLCTYGSIIKTDLMYKSNLSFFQLQRYIKELIHQGLLEEDHQTGRRSYAITEKGRCYIQAFQQLMAALS